jgi:single-strand DNA-binding protein
MINKVIIVGHLGQDPEVRALPSGANVCSFSVATTERFKDAQGEKQERTEWHRIKAFGSTADNCGKYLNKGSKVYIEGRIQSGKYTDKDGVEKTTFEIIASAVTFLDSKDK